MSKQWKTDTLNHSGTRIVQIRYDKELFCIKSKSDSEVVLNRQEAQFLLISLQRALEDNTMKIKVGTKVTGNWGAMHSLSSGKIIKIKRDTAEIIWDDLEEGIEIVNLSSIHEKGYRSANGSGIGIFINEDK